MKTYTDFPSQKSGNQWVGFRLLTAIPEVPVGHNSGENRTSYHHRGGCVPGLFQSHGVNRKRLCSRWHSSLSCLWWEVLWTDTVWSERLLFLSPFLYRPLSPTRALTISLGVTWPWLLYRGAWVKWSQPQVRGEKCQSNMKMFGDFCIRSTPTELTKLMLNRLFPSNRLIYFHQILSCHTPQVCLD